MNSVDELNLLLGIGPARPQLPVTLRKSGYLPVRALGKGSYGQALLVFHEPRQQYFVVKHLNLAGMSSRQRHDAHNEINILQKLHHPNIVQYVEYYEEHPHLYIVMEYADGGDVFSLLSSAQAARRAGARAFRGVSNSPANNNASGLLSEAQVVSLFVQTTMAVRYMHDRRLLHRDIKSSNIFLTKNHIVKLGDFGISTVLQSTMAMASTMCGTPCYFSPELCQGRPYNNKSDMWALGVLLYELCAGHVPFESTTMKTLMRDIVHRQPARIPAIYSDALWDLVVQLLQKDPRRRPDAGQVLMSSALMRYVPELIEQLASDPAYAAAAAAKESDCEGGVEHLFAQRGAGVSQPTPAVRGEGASAPSPPPPPPRRAAEVAGAAGSPLGELPGVSGANPLYQAPARRESRPAGPVMGPGAGVAHPLTPPPISPSAASIAALLARFDAQKQQLAESKLRRHEPTPTPPPLRQGPTAAHAAEQHGQASPSTEAPLQPQQPQRVDGGNDNGVVRLSPGAVAALRQQGLDAESDSQVFRGGGDDGVKGAGHSGAAPVLVAAAAPRRSFAPPPLPAALRDSAAFPLPPAQNSRAHVPHSEVADDVATAVAGNAPTGSAELGAVLTELSSWRERSLRRQRSHDEAHQPSPLTPTRQRTSSNAAAAVVAGDAKVAKQRPSVPTPTEETRAAVAAPAPHPATPPSASAKPDGHKAGVAPPTPPSAVAQEQHGRPPQDAPAHPHSPRGHVTNAATAAAASPPTSPFAKSAHDDDVNGQSFVDAMGTTLDVQALQEAPSATPMTLHRHDPRQSMHKSFHGTREKIDALRATLPAGSVVNIITAAAAEPDASSVTDGAAASDARNAAFSEALADGAMADLCFTTACLCGRATTTGGCLSMIYGSFICACDVCVRWTGAAQGVEWLHLPPVVEGLAGLLGDSASIGNSGGHGGRRSSEVSRHTPSPPVRRLSAGGGAVAAAAFRAQAAHASNASSSRAVNSEESAETVPASEKLRRSGIRSYTHRQPLSDASETSAVAVGIGGGSGTLVETYVIYSCTTCGGMLGMVHDGVQGLLLPKATLDAQSLQILSSCAQTVVEEEDEDE